MLWWRKDGFFGSGINCKGAIHDFGTTQEPVGDEQDGGEYCDQTMTGEDTGYGDYYYPIEGSSQYMRIEYSL